MSEDKEIEEELELVDIDDLSPLNLPITPPSGLTPENDSENLLDSRKRSKKRILTISIIILIVLGIITGGVFAVVNLLSTVTTTSSTDKATTTTSLSQNNKLTAKALVTKAKTAVTGQVKTTITNPNSTTDNVYRAPSYQPNGYQFSVYPTTDTGFGSYGKKDTIVTDLSAIKTVLKANGLTENILDQGSDTGSFVGEYKSDDVVCILTDEKPQDPSPDSTDYNTILGCANTADYIANAAALRSYYIVYIAQTRDHTNIVMTGPTITASKTPGYILSTVSIGGADYDSVGGFAGLFYATPDGTLHYFTGTQSELSCDQYSSDDLKKAYLGTTCYSTGNDAAAVTL